MNGKHNQKFFDHARQSATESFKTSSKRAIQKTLESTGVWLVIKLLIKSQKYKKFKNKLIQRQLQMRIIKKYLKKDIRLQKKDQKFLMKWD